MYWDPSKNTNKNSFLVILIFFPILHVVKASYQFWKKYFFHFSWIFLRFFRDFFRKMKNSQFIDQKKSMKNIFFKTDMKLSQHVKYEYVNKNGQKRVFRGVFWGVSIFVLTSRKGPWTVYYGWCHIYINSLLSSESFLLPLLQT